MTRKRIRHWQSVWRWFACAVIGFVLSVSIFVNFNLAAIDPPLGIGEIRQIPVTEAMGPYNQKYETEITGGKQGVGYGVGIEKEKPRSTGIVKVDGVVPKPDAIPKADSIKIQDAKGFGYPVNNNGSWQGGNKGNRVRAKQAGILLRQIEGAKQVEQKYGKKVTVEWSLAEKKYENAFNEELVEEAKKALKNKPNSTVTEEDLKKYSAKHVEPSKEAREMWDAHQKTLRANRKKKSAPSGSSY